MAKTNRTRRLRSLAAPLPALAVLGGLVLSACTSQPPPDVPYMTTEDAMRELAAIETALESGEETHWRARYGNLKGWATPGEAYESEDGRPCREIDFSVDAGFGIGPLTRTERFCRRPDGEWMPHVPLSAGAGAATPEAHASRSDQRQARRRDLARRLQRTRRALDLKFEDPSEVKRQLRRRFTAEERRTVR